MSTTPLHDDFVPLPARLRTLHLLRIALVVLAAGGTIAGAPRVALAPLVAMSAVYLVIAFATELVRKLRRRLPSAVVGGMLLVDGVYIAAVLLHSGGATSRLAFLTSVHLVAVTLVASYRTGLKVAAWHSLLLIAAYYAGKGGVLGPAVPLSAAVFGVTAFWAVAVATAVFSAINERELRRSRAGFRALAEMGRRLEEASDPSAVLEVLLRSVTQVFGTGRGAVLLADGEALNATVLAHDVVTTRRWQASGSSLLEDVRGDGQPKLVASLDADRDPVIAALLPSARNLAVVPLAQEGEANGVLVVEFGGRSGARITKSALALLHQFASHGALAHGSSLLHREAARLATQDGLTALSNRRAFDDSLEREMSRARRFGDALALVIFDVDHFKRVNDVHGHQVGDDVLRHVAAVLAQEARSMDVAARYGGEEFALILPSCPVDDAVAVAERVRTALGDDVGVPVPITVSAGVAALSREATSPEQLVRAADAALYTAKARGRNRTVCADDIDVDRVVRPGPEGLRDEVVRLVHANGTISLFGRRISVGRRFAGARVSVRVDQEELCIWLDGELLKVVPPSRDVLVAAASS